MDVIEQGAAGVAGIGGVDSAGAQARQHPAINSAEAELTFFRPLTGSRHMVQDPSDFGG
jgi:hypothetical protein